ncbi:MAG: hypothetical protein ACRD2A_17605 [Vicinamibacterales bacterium]
MKRLLSSAVVGIFMLTAVPIAQDDVSGAWDLTINGPQGVINAGVTLKQEGDKVSGTFSGPQGDVETTGTVKGHTVSLAFSVSTSQGTLSVTMTGEVTGGSMKGVLDFQMGTADFTGTKK